GCKGSLGASSTRSPPLLPGVTAGFAPDPGGLQKKPRRSGASKWEERRPKRDDHSLAESSKCVPIEVAFIPSVRRQMCIANCWAISAVLKHFDENWIGGYKKGVCPFSHPRMRTTLLIITTGEAANQVSYAAETRFACDRDRFACKSFERNWEQMVSSEL